MQRIRQEKTNDKDKDKDEDTMSDREGVELALLAELASFQQWALQPKGREYRRLRFLVQEIKRMQLRLDVLEGMKTHMSWVDPLHMRSVVTNIFLFDARERAQNLRETHLMELVENLGHWSRPFWAHASPAAKQELAKTYYAYLDFYFTSKQTNNDDVDDDDDVDDVDDDDDVKNNKKKIVSYEYILDDFLLSIPEHDNAMSPRTPRTPRTPSSPPVSKSLSSSSSSSSSHSTK